LCIIPDLTYTFATDTDVPVKKILQYLLITLTCFNLAGGYAIAATTIAQATSPEASHILPHRPHQQELKKSAYDVQLLQLNKEDSEEDDLVPPFFAIGSLGVPYQFTPDFKLLNKHFLLHYGAAIKDKHPDAYILHQNFRL
jgi:hypothetical protein